MTVFSAFTGAALPDRADVVIIGAGIMGCATAYYLAKRGIKAVLIDKSRIAPSVKERDAADQPPIIPPGLTPVHPSPQSDGGPVTRNYGIAIDKLASDTRTIRASDPETLDRVIEQARKKPSCPDDDSDKDPAPAFVPPPSGNGDLIAYGVACALGIAAAVVLMTNKNASPK